MIFTAEFTDAEGDKGLEGNFEASTAEEAIELGRMRWKVSADSTEFPNQRAYPAAV